MEHVLTTTNLFWPVLGVLAALVGLIWNALGKRIDILEQTNRTCPIHRVDSDLAEIKNDIKWIKGYLFNNSDKK